jgi:hypothetical protein
MRPGDFVDLKRGSTVRVLNYARNEQISPHVCISFYSRHKSRGKWLPEAVCLRRPHFYYYLLSLFRTKIN